VRTSSTVIVLVLRRRPHPRFLGVWRILERKPYAKNHGLKPSCRTNVENEHDLPLRTLLAPSAVPRRLSLLTSHVSLLTSHIGFWPLVINWSRFGLES